MVSSRVFTDNTHRYFFLRIAGHSSFFKRLTVANSKSVLEPNSIVKLKVSASGKGGRGHIVFGCITGFEIAEELDASEERYFGHGRIRYIREPREVFGILDQSVSLGAIDFTSEESVKVSVCESFVRVACIFRLICSIVLSHFIGPRPVQPAKEPYNTYTRYQSSTLCS